ncbi:MAG: tail fiber protein [Saprospiraceae bacterium]|nr:tail fiber protein [Saprospiraceae bacterium]
MELSAKVAETEAELQGLRSLNEQVSAWSEPTLGQIAMFAGTFAPRGWATCDGTLLSITEHQSLYSLLGTTYGGDGRITFALPDLRGRVPVHAGEGPGLHPHVLGSKFGVEFTDLKTSRFPVTQSDNAAVNVAIGTDPDQISTRQPTLGVTYIIALVGNFPSRS